MELINFKTIISIAWFDNILYYNNNESSYRKYRNFICNSLMFDKISYTADVLTDFGAAPGCLSKYELSVIAATKRQLKYLPDINAFDLYDIIK